MGKSSATNDPSQALLDALEQIDVSELTFMQLRRLQAALETTGNAVDTEVEKRSADDGDDTNIQEMAKAD